MKQLLILVSSCLIVACNDMSHLKGTNQNSAQDSTLNNDSIISSTGKATNPSYWDSKELDFPEGVVTSLQRAEDINSNSVTIRKPDGNSVVLRDVDPFVWTELKEGDILR